MAAPETAEGGHVRWVDAGPGDDGQRLDNFLAKILKGVPKSHLYRIIRTGQVRVNGARRGAHSRVASGDRIRIPPVRRAGPRRAPRPFEDPLPVLYEDEHVVAYDKPAGLAVHGGSGVSAGLIERVRSGESREGRAAEMQLVHRLDRDTSGIVMVAKRRPFLRELHALFREGKVGKRYVALVRGQWLPEHGTLDAPLAKWRRRGDERVVAVDPGGQEAVTTTRLLAQWGPVGKIEVGLLTGRTHQIRVHLSHAGLPVVGDDKYGDFRHNREVRALGCDRLMLHAHRVSFTHPVTGERTVIKAPLPGEFAVLERGMSGGEDPGEPASPGDARDR